MTEQTGRRCVFCPQPAGSREHALPGWLARAMGVELEPAQPGLISSERGIEPQGNPRATGNLVTKGVCGDCNNGWMRELEDQIIPILSPLVAPDYSTFTREAFEPLRANLPLLTRWLMKTAVTMSLVAPRGELGSLPDDAPAWAFQDAVPPTCMLYAGWIDDAHFSKTLGRGFRVLNGGEFHGNQIHDHSFNLCLQLNHLGLRFVNAPNATWGLTECRDASGNLCSPSILMPTGYFGAAAGDTVRFKDFFDFSRVCVLATGGLPERLDPEEERKMMESVRRLIP